MQDLYGRSNAPRIPRRLLFGPVFEIGNANHLDGSDPAHRRRDRLHREQCKQRGECVFHDRSRHSFKRLAVRLGAPIQETPNCAAVRRKNPSVMPAM